MLNSSILMYCIWAALPELTLALPALPALTLPALSPVRSPATVALWQGKLISSQKTWNWQFIVTNSEDEGGQPSKAPALASRMATKKIFNHLRFKSCTDLFTQRNPQVTHEGNSLPMKVTAFMLPMKVIAGAYSSPIAERFRFLQLANEINFYIYVRPGITCMKIRMFPGYAFDLSRHIMYEFFSTVSAHPAFLSHWMDHLRSNQNKI